MVVWLLNGTEKFASQDALGFRVLKYTVVWLCWLEVTKPVSWCNMYFRTACLPNISALRSTTLRDTLSLFIACMGRAVVEEKKAMPFHMCVSRYKVRRRKIHGTPMGPIGLSNAYTLLLGSLSLAWLVWGKLVFSSWFAFSDISVGKGSPFCTHVTKCTTYEAVQRI